MTCFPSPCYGFPLVERFLHAGGGGRITNQGLFTIQRVLFIESVWIGGMRASLPHSPLTARSIPGSRCIPPFTGFC